MISLQSEPCVLEHNYYEGVIRGNQNLMLGGFNSQESQFIRWIKVSHN